MGGCCPRFRPRSRTDSPVSDAEITPVLQDATRPLRPPPSPLSWGVSEGIENTTEPSPREQRAASRVAGQQAQQIWSLKRQRDDPPVVPPGSITDAGSR